MATWFHDEGEDLLYRARQCYLCNGTGFQLTKAGEVFMDIMMDKIKEGIND